MYFSLFMLMLSVVYSECRVCQVSLCWVSIMLMLGVDYADAECRIFHCYAQFHYIDGYYAECHYAECLDAC
jgi:hypothetical protein